MKRVLLPILIVAASALENYRLTPHAFLRQPSEEGPLVLAQASWQDYGNVPCQYMFQEGFYNLFNPFDSNYFSSKSSPATTTTIYFNFCQKLGLDTDFAALGCDTYSDYFALAVNTVGSTTSCAPLSTDSLLSISNSTWTDSSNQKQLAVQFTDQSGFPLLKVNLVCQQDAANTTSGTYVFDGNFYTTTITGPQACPLFTISALWAFVWEYKYFFGAVMILIGLFLGLLGRKLWLAAIFLLSALITMAVIILVFYTTFLKSTTADWVAWTVLACSFIFGIILGFTMMKCARPGAAIIAAWGGFVLGLLINEAVLYLVTSQYVFWAVCGGCAVVAGILVFVTYNHAIIISTSLVGSYFFVRGISLYAGGFPDEILILKAMRNDTVLEQPVTLWIYLGGILISTIICAVVQYRQLAKMDEYEKHPYEQLR